MWSLQLAVNHASSVFLHKPCKVYESDFAAVGHEREHAFPHEACPDAHAVESAYKSVSLVVPHFHAVGKSLAVKFGIGAYHVVAKPCALMVDAQFGAVGYDGIKVVVDAAGVSVSVAIEKCAHGMRHVYLVRKYHKTLHGAVPHDFIAVAKRIPWEDAVGIGKQQAVDAKVAADGKKSVGVAETRVGKHQLLVGNSVYHIGCCIGVACSVAGGSRRANL